MVASVVSSTQDNISQKMKLVARTPEQVRAERHSKAKDKADPYKVTDEAATADHHLFIHYFKSGDGDIRVINETFHRHKETGKSGVWEAIADADMKTSLTLQLQPLYIEKLEKKGGVRRIHKFAHSNAAKSAFIYNRDALNVPLSQRNEDGRYIGFLNSDVLDTATGDLLPYRKEMFLTSQIQAEYTPGRDCPDAFREFVKRAYGEDKLELLRAIIRYYLDSSLPSGYFVHFTGPSGSGKGTTIRYIGSMHGKFYKALSEFHVLNTPEGRHQALTGARVVAFPDVTYALGKLGAFYELVDNGSLTGRALYSSDAPSRKWNVRFLVASVGPIQFEKSDGGWDRRVVPLATLSRSGDTDDSIGEKLEACKADVISWAMGMDRDRVMHLLKHPPGSAELKDAQAVASDSIKGFIDSCLQPDSEASEPVHKSVFYAYYKAYCAATGSLAKGQNRFCIDMKSSLGESFETRRTTERGVNIPSRFVNMRAIDGLFNGDPDSGEIACCTQKLSEGGLELFRNFDPSQQFSEQPETPTISADSIIPSSSSDEPSKPILHGYHVGCRVEKQVEGEWKDFGIVTKSDPYVVWVLEPNRSHSGDISPDNASYRPSKPPKYMPGTKVEVKNTELVKRFGVAPGLHSVMDCDPDGKIRVKGHDGTPRHWIGEAHFEPINEQKNEPPKQRKIDGVVN